jgi:Ca2+-binding EF-hand superfamily protein/ankyrin repeat protein
MDKRNEQYVDEIVEEILRNPKNLASEIELREQASVALKYFKDYDIDKTNTLSFDEIKLLCNNLGLPMENDEEEMLMKMDTDDSGVLEMPEWLSWWLKRISTLPNPMKQQEAIAKTTFQKFDQDNSGILDASELTKLIEALGGNFTEEEVQQAIQEIDQDGSNSIEISEFVLWWTNRIMSKRSSSSLIAIKLKKLAAKANQIFSTDIFTACWQGDLLLVKNLVEMEKRLMLSSDESEFGDGWTALHYISYRGHIGILEMLLGEFKGALNINITNNQGFTPLFYAAQQGHIRICELLLENNADPTMYGAVKVLDSEGIETSETIVMCPIDFILDYPELRGLFKSHSKCKEPKRLVSGQFEVNLVASSGALCLLNLNLSVTQKNLSTIPIRSWETTLRWQNKDDFINNLVNFSKMEDFDSQKYNSMLISIPANHPNNEQSIKNFQIDSKFVHYLQFFYFLQVLSSFTISTGSNSILSELSGGDVIDTIFQYFKKLYLMLPSSFKSYFTRNYYNNVEAFFLEVLGRICRPTDITGVLSYDLSSMVSQLTEQIEAKHLKLQKIAEIAQKELAANLKVKSRKDAEKDISQTTISKYLTLEQLEEVVNEFVQANGKTIKSALSKKSIIVENTPALLFTAKVVVKNSLFKSEDSDEAQAKLSFGL